MGHLKTHTKLSKHAVIDVHSGEQLWRLELQWRAILPTDKFGRELHGSPSEG